LERGRLYAGTDRGLYVREGADGDWLMTGLPPNVSVRAVAVDPHNNEHILVSGGNGLFLSVNRGASWTSKAIQQAPNMILFHPSVSGLVLAGVSGGMLFSSSDGGQTWQQAKVTSRYGILDFAIDSESKIAYAASMGLLKSIDGGVTWVPTGFGLPDNVWVRSLAIDPANHDILYAGTGKGVFVSADRGERWLPLHDGLGLLDVTQIVALPGEFTALLALGNWGGLGYGDAGPVWYYSVSTLPTPPPTPTSAPTLTPWPTNTLQPTSRPTLTPWSSPTPVEMAGGIVANPSFPAVETAAVELGVIPDATSTPELFLPPEAQEDEGGLGLLPLFGGLVGLATVAALVAWMVIRRRRQPVARIPAAPPIRPESAPSSPDVMPAQGTGVAVVRCPECGAQNEARNRFCLKCGNRLS
jgi:hypothetical protein